MPQKRSRSGPPEVMTWGKATPVFVFAILFDSMRVFFTFFWFFGPALLGAYCTAKVGDVWAVGGLLTAGCAAGAVAVGSASIALTATFGTVMAMATGFAGWLFIGGWLMATNARIFKENALWFVGSLMVSEVPFVGALPAITIVVWKMYRTQIRVENAAFKKYQEEQKATQLQERRQQETQLMQAQTAQLATADVY